MNDWQKRVIEEQADLIKRMGKLELFLDSDECNKLDPIDEELLQDQVNAMSDYSEILKQRIQRFK